VIKLAKNTIKTTLKLLKAVIRNKIGTPRPLVAQWEVTFNCNFKCRYCNVWRHDGNKYSELSPDQMKKVIDQLDELGIVWITFTGGEPLLKKDLDEVIRYCSQKGIMTFMNENGSLLDHKLPKLKGCLDAVSLSLDSPDEKTHDEIRGFKGAFKKVLDSASKSKEHINTIINMTVTSESLKDLEKMAVLCKKNGLKIMFTPVSVIPNEGFEKTISKDVKLDPKEYHDIVLKLSKKYGNVVFFKPYMNLIKNGGISKNNFVCKSSKIMLNIKPNGDIVYPCGYFPIKKFSTKNTSIKSIINSSKEFHGKYFDFCEGCTLACFLTPSLATDNIIELIKFAKTQSR
jgi:MoaA/NifB/PqqE/SkfB family radical SAM enzyme|tara:strand:+ start:165 stop:1193 length:1029 start_codon:yes stop_codon:yes gene_type:complete